MKYSISQSQIKKSEIKKKNYPLLWKLVKRDRVLLLMLTPCLLFIIVFKYVPMYSVLAVFRNIDVIHPIFGTKWVGFYYFKLFFDSYDSWILIRNTLLLNIYQIIIVFPIPILFALLLNEIRHQKFKKFTQTISYIPNFISMVVIAGMMKLMLSPSFGVINRFMAAIGLEKVDFMTKSEWFRTIYITSEVWQTAGWSSIIFLAAISTVNVELYEAAIIDGASKFKQVIHVTLPSIRDTVIIMFIFQFAYIMSSNTEKVLLLYSPLTYDTADVLGTYIYRVGLLGGQYGIGMAVGFFNSVISLILVIIVNKIAKTYSKISIW